MSRVYLDHNATTPLRLEARAAMVEAMELVGNPSSVHAEGRAAKAFLEKCRARLARALGAEGAEIVFTASATEAAALALHGRGIRGAAVEHDAVGAWVSDDLAVDGAGRVSVENPLESTLQLANSETGVIQTLPDAIAVSDMTQALGKVEVNFLSSGAMAAIFSAHKLGGPKGVGALVMARGIDLDPVLKGGGQEMGRRAGTENLIGIAGFAAAAEAAVADVAAGRWDEIAHLRDLLEKAIADAGNLTISVGKDAPRLPNTACFATPGWKGETQVMQMDLKGFAVSAGSACSSGKMRASGVLRAMGFDEATAAGAIRVSLGLETTKDEVMRFADCWRAALQKHQARAA
ncbi:cysteine desulfurase family protein [Rhodalgimonas zhirmunskyi]|uniref:Cysteine desulfurase n=1 Tax=Rhodalgimonas zhirmunskyi TaxID=2964767 RepID=A0AAJ1U4G7_9RHOB|nr:aminotransferase class V-fold PLP-dependent enzyme [Rhodoalgimonas zhirmunskyi]MDQ2093020.1 aminotransferase class V-fold PLP-dependent enzyme [Rhodoalgimonas zhirmunskyi]